MDEELQAAIARINSEVARGNLQLNRDIYQNISLPRFRDIEMPTSYGGLTGFLPGSYPDYGGMPTFGSLAGMAQMFGRAGTDPRFAAMGYGPGQQTEQARQFDVAQGQDYALQTGLPSTIGMGQRLLEARQQLLANPEYQRAVQSQDWTRKNAMEQGVWQQVAGLDQAAAARVGEAQRQLIHASGNIPPAQALEQALQQEFAQQQRGGAQGGGGQGGAQGGGTGFNGLNFAGSGQGAAGYGPGPISQAQRNLMEQARQFDVDAQLRALQQESQLRTDPFALERYRRGLNPGGLPNSIAAMQGGVLPSVQAPQTPAPGQATLGRQAQEIAGTPTFGMQVLPEGSGTATMEGPRSAIWNAFRRGAAQPENGMSGQMAGAQAQLAALPSLHQINARNYMRLDPSGQRYVNSAYRASGMAADDDDIQEAVRRGLPQFARRGVPTFGRIA